MDMKLKLAMLMALGAGGLMLNGAQASDLRQEILSCAAQTSYVARLDCYDGVARGLQTSGAKGEATVNATATATAAVAGTAAAVATPAASNKVAAWTVTRDDKQVSFSTNDKPMTLGGIGIANLTIRCETGKPAELGINWGFDLGGDVYLSISTDKGNAQRVSVRSSPNGEITYYSKPVKPLLLEMLPASYLEVFADDGKRVLRARFMMAGLQQAMADHHPQCGLE
jgi:hypothetical protein